MSVHEQLQQADFMRCEAMAQWLSGTEASKQLNDAGLIFVCAAVIGKAAIAALVLQLGNGTIALQI